MRQPWTFPPHAENGEIIAHLVGQCSAGEALFRDALDIARRQGEIVCEPMSASEREAIKADIQFFAGYLTLAFHEARNVRHLVSAGLLEKSAFRMLIDGLPANRIEAWRVLQPFRRRASEASTGAEAESVFRNKFELSLEDLLVLSSNPHWEGDRLEVIDGPKSMKA